MEISDFRINHSVSHSFTTTGTIGELVEVSSRNLLHVVIKDVDGGNIVEVRGKIDGAADVLLKTITGPTTETLVDTQKYDDIEFKSTTFLSAGGTGQLNASFYAIVGLSLEAQETLNAILAAVGGSMVSVTSQFNATIGTTPVNVPATDGNFIREVLIHNVSTGNKDILVSFDDGTTFKVLTPDASIIWDIKKERKHIVVKGSAASSDYEIIMNREA